MTKAEPNSIYELVSLIQLWAAKPGEGLALVEFVSEQVRQQVIRQLTQTPAIDFEELSFRSSGDVESDVRELVGRLSATQRRVVSVRGFEDAFPMGTAREKAIDALNSLREAIAGSRIRQIWWLTSDGMRLLRHRAPDLLLWFAPQLELPENLPSGTFGMELGITDPITPDSARANLADSRARIETSKGAGVESVDLWLALAYPALRDLHRSGAVAEAARAREAILDLIYGSAFDASRPQRVNGDLDILLNRGSYQAAAELGGAKKDISLPQSDPLAVIESNLNIAVTFLEAGKYLDAERHFRRALADTERVFRGEVAVSISAVYGLGIACLRLGKFDESTKLLERALAGSEHLRGPENRQTISYARFLALVYTTGGRYADAETLYLRALSANERMFGAEHKDTLRSLIALAAFYFQVGRNAEAEQLYLRALSILEKAPDGGQPIFDVVRSNFAVLKKVQQSHVQ